MSDPAKTLEVMREMLLNNIKQFGATAEREACLEFIRVAIDEINEGKSNKPSQESS